MIPKSCKAYYYGGLPVKGQTQGPVWVGRKISLLQVPEGKGGEKIDLRIPFSEMEKIFLTRDNYYGADTASSISPFEIRTRRPIL